MHYETAGRGLRVTSESFGSTCMPVWPQGCLVIDTVGFLLLCMESERARFEETLIVRYGIEPPHFISARRLWSDTAILPLKPVLPGVLVNTFTLQFSG